MKKSMILSLFAIWFVSVSALQAQQIKTLPEPDKRGGTPLMEALSERSSSREFADKTLSDQMISNLLWSAFGVNRPESDKRTAPSSHNVQDIQIYAVTAEGAWLYLPEKNGLRQVNSKDVRAAMGKQDFVEHAGVNLVYVSNFSRYSGDDEQLKQQAAATHCGFIGQNVYLFCASEGLNTVFRGWIDKAQIAEALNLSDNQHVMYSQSVGFPK